MFLNNRLRLSNYNFVSEKLDFRLILADAFSKTSPWTAAPLRIFTSTFCIASSLSSTSFNSVSATLATTSSIECWRADSKFLSCKLYVYNKQNVVICSIHLAPYMLVCCLSPMPQYSSTTLPGYLTSHSPIAFFWLGVTPSLGTAGLNAATAWNEWEYNVSISGSSPTLCLGSNSSTCSSCRK